MVQGYSRTQIALHWGVGALILYQLVMGEDMSALWDAFEDTGSYALTLGGILHIGFGIAILLLALWRLGLRSTRGVPEAPQGSLLMMRAAKLGHWAIYAFMIGLPLSGMAAWFGGVEIAAEVHGGPAKALLWVLIIGHVAMAFYHHFILKDGLLNRMRKPL